MDFKEQLDLFLKKRLNSKYLQISDHTPELLQDVGLNNFPVLIETRNLKKAFANKGNTGDNYHGLGIDGVSSLPNYLDNPAMVLNSLTHPNDSIVVVADSLDKEGHPIVVPLKLNQKANYNFVEIDSNVVMTAYGRTAFGEFLKDNIAAQTLIYLDKEKSQRLLNSGLQLPITLDFKDIIRPWNEDVKNLEQRISMMKLHKFRDDGYYDQMYYTGLQTLMEHGNDDHARAFPEELLEDTKENQEGNMDIPTTEVIKQARERAQRLAMETGEPYVTIEYSESTAFENGDVLSLNEADKKLTTLDAAYNDVGYDKVGLSIDFIKDGKADSYEACRYDIGKEGQGLAAHIQSYWNFHLNNPRRFRRSDREYSKGTNGSNVNDYAYMANVIAPFFTHHLELSDISLKAESANLTAAEVGEVRDFVALSRAELNGTAPSPTVFDEEHKKEIIEKLSEEHPAERSPAAPLNYRDKVNQIRDEMAQTLLDYIEQNPQNWQSGWNNLTAPINGKTNNSYRGFNALYLSLVGMSRGYDDPRWVTFSQAKDLGASIKKGEKSSPVLFFEFYDRLTKKAYDARTTRDMTDEERAAYEKENVYAVLKYSSVFNASQCTNFPERDLESLKMSEEERANQNALIENIIANSAAPVNYDGGNRAYYSPSSDSIHLPEINAFNSMQDYYATALHEIAHSTGHANRLNRDLSGKFGSTSYAVEELRAELACVYMQIEQGIKLEGKHIENHAAYLSSWLNAAKSDKSIFFKAASDAQKIADYVSEHYLQSVQVDQAVIDAEDETQNSTVAEFISPDYDLHEQERQNGTDSRLDGNVREWYTSTFPADELGAELDGGLTFNDVSAALTKGENFYDLVGVEDSSVRERIFWYLAELQDKSYEEIYDAWASSEDRVEVNLNGEQFEAIERGHKILENLNSYDKWKNVSSPTLQEYLKIKHENPGCVVFKRIGDFYEVLGVDAEKIAQELDLTLTGRDVGGSERIPMCGVPFHAIEQYVNVLAAKGENVVIADGADVKMIESNRGEHKEKNPLDENVKQWYTTEFPSDNVGATLDAYNTFVDINESVFNPTEQNANIYEVLGGNATSEVRDRIFSRLAEIKGVTYDDIFNAWAQFDYRAQITEQNDVKRAEQGEHKEENSAPLGEKRNDKMSVQNRTDKSSHTLGEELSSASHWLKINLPNGAVGKNYGSNTLIRMPEGEYSHFGACIPTRFLKQVDGKWQLTVGSNYKYRINNDGKQVELTGQELHDSFAGMRIGKAYKRVAPSRAYAKTFADLEKNVPEEMKALPNWCVYRTFQREDKDKKGKVLKSAVTGEGASSKNPGDWTDFNTAIKYAKENGFAGVSFLLQAKNGITCIDLDECVLNAETGEMKERATKLIDSLKGTYMERSTSGNGVHIFIKDDILKGGKYQSTSVNAQKGDLEVFDDNRVISMTGNMFSETNAMTRAGSAATVYLRNELGEQKHKTYTASTTSRPRVSSGTQMSDSELLQWIRNSKKGNDFDNLYSGRGISGDKSNDDAKLAHILLYFSGGDKDQTFRIMRESGQNRPDKPDSYYHHTIEKVNGMINEYAKRPNPLAGAAKGKVPFKKGDNKGNLGVQH